MSALALFLLGCFWCKCTYLDAYLLALAQKEYICAWIEVVFSDACLGAQTHLNLPRLKASPAGGERCLPAYFHSLH